MRRRVNKGRQAGRRQAGRRQAGRQAGRARGGNHTCLAHLLVLARVRAAQLLLALLLRLARGRLRLDLLQDLGQPAHAGGPVHAHAHAHAPQRRRNERKGAKDNYGSGEEPGGRSEEKQRRGMFAKRERERRLHARNPCLVPQKVRFVSLSRGRAGGRVSSATYLSMDLLKLFSRLARASACSVAFFRLSRFFSACVRCCTCTGLRSAPARSSSEGASGS